MAVVFGFRFELLQDETNCTGLIREATVALGPNPAVEKLSQQLRRQRLLGDCGVLWSDQDQPSAAAQFSQDVRNS
jgi:hypothetical protein